jgi:hypothetical protein
MNKLEIMSVSSLSFNKLKIGFHALLQYVMFWNFHLTKLAQKTIFQFEK